MEQTANSSGKQGAGAVLPPARQRERYRRGDGDSAMALPRIADTREGEKAAQERLHHDVN